MNEDKIIIENFKIFKGIHVFDLRDLNVFTGANNSGKSTLIKAMSLFAKGINKGFFPFIDLIETNSGSFKSLTNRESNSNSFKIGFYISLGKNKNPFKILYEFVDCDSNSLYVEEFGKAYLADFEIYDINNNFFFGAYISDFYRFKITEDIIDYDYDKNQKYKPSYPFECHTENIFGPEVFFRFSIRSLKEHIKDFSNKSFTELINQLQKLYPNKDNWWIPRFNDDDFSFIDLNISEITLENILEDFDKNDFLELMDFDTKRKIFEDQFSEEELNKIEKDYNSLIKKTKYDDFFKEVITPLLKDIKKGLERFKSQNFAHIVFNDFSKPSFKFNDENRFLFRLYKYSRKSKSPFYSYTKEALNIFDIDGIIEFDRLINNDIKVEIIEPNKK